MNVQVSGYVFWINIFVKILIRGMRPTVPYISKTFSFLPPKKRVLYISRWRLIECTNRKTIGDRYLHDHFFEILAFWWNTFRARCAREVGGKRPMWSKFSKYRVFGLISGKVFSIFYENLFLYVQYLYLLILDTFVCLQIAAEPLGRLNMLSPSTENRQLWCAQASLFFSFWLQWKLYTSERRSASLIAAYKNISALFHISVKVGMQQSQI